jgi:hypothetical protein
MHAFMSLVNQLCNNNYNGYFERRLFWSNRNGYSYRKTNKQLIILDEMVKTMPLKYSHRGYWKFNHMVKHAKNMRTTNVYITQTFAWSESIYKS